jgi:L-lysine 2,3-aminomutase
VDKPDLKMATGDISRVADYLRAHREVTSVLITGGDPMIMGAAVLRRYVEPLLDAGLEHIESIRIGTKSLAYWPQRYVTDPDADETMRLFEEVTAAGKSLALMAHFRTRASWNRRWSWRPPGGSGRPARSSGPRPR